MPIYEYVCDACGHEFDELQKFAAAALIDCPSCGKPALIKKVSAAGFQLKGTGWYATDFKSKKKDAPVETKADAAGKPEAKSESKPEAKTESKTEAKAESKPEKKPETKPAKKADSKDGAG